MEQEESPIGSLVRNFTQLINSDMLVYTNQSLTVGSLHKFDRCILAFFKNLNTQIKLFSSKYVNNKQIIYYKGLSQQYKR